MPIHKIIDIFYNSVSIDSYYRNIYMEINYVKIIRSQNIYSCAQLYALHKCKYCSRHDDH